MSLDFDVYLRSCPTDEDLTAVAPGLALTEGSLATAEGVTLVDPADDAVFISVEGPVRVDRENVQEYESPDLLAAFDAGAIWMLPATVSRDDEQAGLSAVVGLAKGLMRRYGGVLFDHGTGKVYDAETA